MNYQRDFDELMHLLQQNAQTNPLAREIVEMADQEIVYHTSISRKKTDLLTKERLLSLYEFRYKNQLELHPESMAEGWESLLNAFRTTKQQYICISSIFSDLGYVYDLYG